MAQSASVNEFGRARPVAALWQGAGLRAKARLMKLRSVVIQSARMTALVDYKGDNLDSPGRARAALASPDASALGAERPSASPVRALTLRRCAQVGKGKRTAAGEGGERGGEGGKAPWRRRP